MNLRNRFLIPTVLLLVIGMGFTIAAVFFSAGRIVRQLVESELIANAKSVNKLLSFWLEDRKHILLNLSHQPLFQDAAEDSYVGKAARVAANTLLEKFLSEYPEFESVAITSVTGEGIASGKSEEKGQMLIPDKTQTEMVITGEIVISPVSKSKSGFSQISYLFPIQKKGKTSGILIGKLNLTHFSDQFLKTNLAETKRVDYVMNSQAIIILHTDQSKLFTDMSKNDFTRDIMQKKSGMIRYNAEGKPLLSGFQHIPTYNWYVISSAIETDAMGPINQLGITAISIGIAVILIIAAMIFYVSRNVVKSVFISINKLREGIREVDHASDDLIKTSQEIASGASEQAGSIEEISSSLQEMASTTRKNAENANYMKQMINEVSAVTLKTKEAMDRLITAITEINSSSNETAGIVKRINEIAFQTNLLALNASVEAARAGEAGKGFAVVADEVRNLAQRCAQAAKITEELIEKSRQSSEKGVSVTNETHQFLDGMQENIYKTVQVIEEITLSMNEHAHGIEQLTTAISQINTVTQTNASNADESAFACKSLSDQAKNLNSAIETLSIHIVGKRKTRSLDSTSKHKVMYAFIIIS